MKKIHGLVFIVILGLFQSCNNTDNKDSVDKAKDANENKDTTSMSGPKKDTVAAMPVNGDVATFAVKAANAGMAEIKLGNLAADKGMAKSVKDYGSMMIKDHTKAADELKTLAAAKNITLPATVSDEMQKHIDDLSKKTGNDFDKDYVNMMVSDHKDVIAAFEDEAKNSKDPEFKSLAAKTLPTLYKHLGAAKAIQKTNNF